MAILAQLVDDVVVNKSELTKERFIIGRHPDSDIQIKEISVSGEHALITREKSEFFKDAVEYHIEDQGSTNGTFINDEKISGRRRLLNNDIVRVAWNDFKFIDDTESTLEKTAHILED
ncbi:MAG: FHA domain-containing protein [Pseudomonadales bacterium]|nr:FHA domain-containing protein [Pseudomonadales bacterium]